MVLFGAPLEEPVEAQAVEQPDALAMQAPCAPSMSWRSSMQLQMRIGLHQGTAIVGNFGSASGRLPP